MIHNRTIVLLDTGRGRVSGACPSSDRQVRKAEEIWITSMSPKAARSKGEGWCKAQLTISIFGSRPDPDEEEIG